MDSNSSMSHLFSFSVYGSSPKYIVGAIQNALDIQKLGPSFGSVFYCGESLPDTVIQNLELAGGLVRRESKEWHPNGMFWRFQAQEEFFDCDVMFRDVDSRINSRELEAVKEWLDSDSELHIMRDHPYHNARILGGMWGARAGCSALSKLLLKSKSYGLSHGQDQEFLMNEVYPRFQHNSFVHDSFYNFESHSKFFPTKRIKDEFVGESVDEFGNNDSQLREILRKAENSRVAKFRFTIRASLSAKIKG
jgi:hypothetical protein